MAKFENILETIGNTPLVRLKKIEDMYQVNNNLFAKLESFNPGTSVKTRPAYMMIKTLYEEGKIDESYTFIESTSGNTGIGIALVGAYFGNKVIITMPETVSKERIDILKHYGATVYLTEADKGIKGSNELALKLLKEIKNSIQPSQFDNPNNPLSHYRNTAIELNNDLNDIAYIFATVGTGGTVSGLGRYFKESGLDTKIIAIEPKNSPVLSTGKAGKHKIQGTGPGFVPENFNYNFVDEIILADDDEAYQMTKLLPRVEGISAGISSGACLITGINYLKERDIIGKNIVFIFPDSGEKYFSTGVFD